MKKATLVYVVADGKVLMARKGRKIGAGCYFGYGGKKKCWQSWKGCLISETWEESGGKKELRVNQSEDGGIRIKRKDLEYMGTVDFYNGDRHEVPFGKPSFRVRCYRATQYTGRAISTVEMGDPRWFPISQIPFKTSDMKAGDELFVPLVISGTGIAPGAWIRFDGTTKQVLEYSIEPAA